MDQTAVLYALSTLAQTCAALAAFVGAVGLFRLQAIRDQRRDAEREMRGPTFYMVGPEAAEILPLQNLHAEVVARAESNPAAHQLHAQAYHRARERWEGFSSIYSRSRLVLFIFEGWNLLVIGVALVCFNFVGGLVIWKGTFWALWATALGTVGVTGWCVYAWTRE